MRNIGNILLFIFGGLLGGLGILAVWKRNRVWRRKGPGMYSTGAIKAPGRVSSAKAAVRSSFFCLKKYAIMPSPIEYHETPLL